MEKIKVDAIGKKCPMPVIMTKNALKEIEEGEIEVLVDNEISMENVEKLCVENNYEYSVIKNENIYKIVVLKKQGLNKTENTNSSEDTVIVIDSDVMGKGDEVLGKTLMKGFIYTLTELEVLPKVVIFYNKGVYLVTDESENIEDLRKLQELGVKIYSCGACVNFYNLKEKIHIGEITNMYNIINLQMKGQRIIKP